MDKDSITTYAPHSTARWYHRYTYTSAAGPKLVIDWRGIALNAFRVLLFSGLALFVLAVVTDVVQSVRAEPAVVACGLRQMNARRYSFTDSVVCVPHPYRRDTVYLEVPRG
jgi:hypothetical protein